jgi:hypothetical protein
MNDVSDLEMELALRQTFAAQADTVPASAAARVRASDYHPRQHRLRTPVLVGGGTLAGAATVGAVLSIVLGGAAPAYAGWSAVPTARPAAAAPALSGNTGSPSSSSAAASQCEAALQSPHGPAGIQNSGTWTPVLTDVRGPFTTMLFDNGSSTAACFESPSFLSTNVFSGSGTSGAASASGTTRVNSMVSASGSAPPNPNTPNISVSGATIEGTASGDLQSVVQNHLSTSQDGAYTLIAGRTADGVTGVTLVRDDGQDVVATVDDGWFVAWWPGSATATSAQVTNASGTTTQAFTGASVVDPSLPPHCATPTTSPNGQTVRCSGGVMGSAPTGNSGPSTNESGSSASGNSGNTGS